jgi:hypothetical protein
MEGEKRLERPKAPATGWDAGDLVGRRSWDELEAAAFIDVGPPIVGHSGGVITPPSWYRSPTRIFRRPQRGPKPKKERLAILLAIQRSDELKTELASRVEKRWDDEWRMIAYLAWQKYPEHFGRDKYPAARVDPGDGPTEDALYELTGIVRQALRKSLQNPRK